VPAQERPDFQWQETDDRIAMSAGDLAIVFDRTGDRWTHHIELDRLALHEFARAVESATESDAPARIASPVYQEIHRHDRPNQEGLCCLLTGLVFQHHFSAVVTLSGAALEPATFVLEFDVADRCRSEVETMAATYLVSLDSSDLADADPHRIVWAGGKLGQARLELLAPPPAVLALAEAGRQATRVQAVAPVERATFTHRLRYSWRWTSASSLTR
jgi:hypothetical protein